MRVEPTILEIHVPGARPVAVGDSRRPGEPSPIDALEGVWWLVHTKPRNEKAIAADLASKGIGYFLPLAKLQRRYGGRTTQVKIPLFPGYLFLCGGEEERHATLMTHRAVNVIYTANQERLKSDLRHLYRATTSDEPVDLYPAIRQGRRCRVIAGSLKGLEGVVLRRRNMCRVYIGVEILGQSAEIEIDPSLLEVIE